MSIGQALVLLTTVPLIFGDYAVTVNPRISWVVWEGWGVSLAWWAKTFGQRNDFADLLFTQQYVNYQGQRIPGLGLNLVRYNAGACTYNTINGQRIQLSPNIPKFKQIEGYWLNWSSNNPLSPSWNWTNVDYNQRSMMRKAQARGVNVFELFSNSPLWWMCYNHNPSGGENGENNLQSWNYKQHAIYLATIAKYAQENWGVRFTSVDPFNEPSGTWWLGNGTQEGCHIHPSIQQEIIGYLRAELDSRGLTNTVLSASDESSYDTATNTWNSFNATTKSKVGRLNVHGYQYEKGRRDLLYTAANAWGLPIWNSEYGDRFENGLELAVNLHLDFYWLHPVAWVYWQPLDYGGWGLIQADGSNGWTGPINNKYFILSQYTRHIRKGMKIVNSGDGNSIVAYDAASKKLVIVTLNPATSSTTVTYDLSQFSQADGSGKGHVRRWITNVNSDSNSAPSQYAMYNDTYLNGKKFFSTFPAKTVQTFEVDNVTV